jgi:ABC-type nitrate/sulfonate/bicarbonate transport system substrate-binding protein
MPALSAEPPTQIATEKIMLRYTRCAAAPTTSSLAAQLDYFDDEFKDEPGLTLSLGSLSLDPKLNPTRAEQFSLRHAGIKSAWARAQGARLRIVALSHLQSHYSIWALAGSGIASVADLKGKRLAVAVSKNEKTLDLARAGNLQSYENALGTVGIGLDQAHLVDVVTEPLHFDGKTEHAVLRAQHKGANRDILFKLIRDEVDAVTGGFSPELAAQLGLVRIFDSREETHPAARRPSLRALVVHETLLEEKFDWVVRILARHLQAAEWARSHPIEAVKLVARDHGLAPKELEHRFPQLIKGLQLDLAPDKIESVEQQKNFYLRHGFIPNDFDAKAWIDPRPLEAAYLLAEQRGYLSSSSIHQTTIQI